MRRITCAFNGHMWSTGALPRIDHSDPKGRFIVHRRCLRCGKYERLHRKPVASSAKETN